MSILVRRGPAALLALGAGCAGADRTPTAPLAATLALKKAAPTAVAVEFTDCVESIGVGRVTTAVVRPLVAPGFVLAGEGQPVTPLVVRTARCDIAVDGARAKQGEIVQIGAIVVPPDGTGDVNSALLWYYTSDAKLWHALDKGLGVDAQHVPTLDYALAPGAPGVARALAVTVPKQGNPSLTVAGTVTESTAPAGTFVANWWTRTAAGRVKMATTVPVIRIGGASLTLTTPPGGAPGALIGGGSAGFPLVQQFNTFAAAHMTVAVVP